MSGPKILMLHPANTTPANFAKLVGSFDNFECVYPQAAANLRWQHLGDSPDVAALLKIEADFICGMSSGAFMCARMLEAKQYRGAAMVAGGFIKALRPRPTPLMVVHGTEDEQVPYHGTRYVWGALDTASSMNQLLHKPLISPTRQDIPNPKADGCKTLVLDWGGKVRCYTIQGGGHTYPTPRPVWQPKELGRVCKDFDATAELGTFFKGLL